MFDKSWCITASLDKILKNNVSPYYKRKDIFIRLSDIIVTEKFKNFGNKLDS